jgi:methionyl-tRNA formyltransferase
MNLLFCGTPSFAVPTLERLAAAGHQISLVVTQPDRPKGRGLELVASPVKQSALKLGLPITQPDRIKKNDEFHAQLAALNPDAIIVVGYGRIIPNWMLDLPPLGNLNLHASLLPKYRGAAPIQWAIAQGETVTGVTTMRIDAGLDTGDILLQQEMPIAPGDTSETLSPRLATIGADLMIETLRGLQAKTIQPIPQDQFLPPSTCHSERSEESMQSSRTPSLAPILKKEDGLVDFSRTATETYNRMRGFQPWPGAHTKFRGKTLQILRAQPAAQSLTPAEIYVEHDRLLVGCGQNTALELLEVQLEGKKRTSARDFIHGYRLHSGETLGV